MLKTYITTVPLQGKLDPMLYQRDHVTPPVATCFPIVQVMRDTLEPGDTVQLLAIRQENADTARNYQRLLEELAQLGIAQNQVRQIDLPEDQRPETLIGLCRDLVDALPHRLLKMPQCLSPPAGRFGLSPHFFCWPAAWQIPKPHRTPALRVRRPFARRP